MLAEILGECLDLLGLSAFGAAHAQREANHDFFHAILPDYSVKVREVMFLIFAVQRIQALSRHAERVGDGHSDSAQAYVESEYAGFTGLHLGIIERGGVHLALLRSFAPLDSRLAAVPTCLLLVFF